MALYYAIITEFKLSSTGMVFTLRNRLFQSFVRHIASAVVSTVVVMQSPVLDLIL